MLWLGRPRQPSRNALLCAVFDAVLLGEVMEDVPLYGGFIYFYLECGCEARNISVGQLVCPCIVFPMGVRYDWVDASVILV